MGWTADEIKRRLRFVRYEAWTEVLREPVRTPDDIRVCQVPVAAGKPVRVPARLGLELDWRVARDEIRSLCKLPIW